VLAAAAGGSQAAPSTHRIAFTSAGKIFTIRPDGSGMRRVTSGAKSDGDPDWSPDRRYIAFTRATMVGEHEFRGDPIFRQDILVVGADGGATRTLIRSGSDPQWSPTGTSLVFRRYSKRGDPEIWLAGADGTEPRRLGRGENPAWSPDGRTIAFERWAGDDYRVFVVGTDGRNEHPLVTTPKLSGSSPSWSPDGKRIAFFGDTDDDFPDLDESLYVVSRVGTGLRKLADVMFGERDMTANWSPDGRTLLFARYREPSPRTALYTIRSDGTGLKRLRLETRDPEWSHDGRHIAFTRGSGLFVMRADGATTRRLAQGLAVGTYIDW
jgi:TolB protein